MFGRNGLVIPSYLADESMISRTIGTVGFVIETPGDGIDCSSVRSSGNRSSLFEVENGRSRHVPVMIAMIAHKVDGREIELAATDRTPRSLEDPGVVGI